MELPYNPANPFLGRCPKETKTDIETKISRISGMMPVFVAVFPTARR
jgi:hypothetical protein